MVNLITCKDTQKYGKSIQNPTKKTSTNYADHLKCFTYPISTLGQKALTNIIFPQISLNLVAKNVQFASRNLVKKMWWRPQRVHTSTFFTKVA